MSCYFPKNFQLIVGKLVLNLSFSFAANLSRFDSNQYHLDIRLLTHVIEIG